MFTWQITNSTAECRKWFLQDFKKWQDNLLPFIMPHNKVVHRKMPGIEVTYLLPEWKVFKSQKWSTS